MKPPPTWAMLTCWGLVVASLSHSYGTMDRIVGILLLAGLSASLTKGR